jgi:hypothetical protein
LRGSSNNFRQNTDEKGKDSSPTKVPIKDSVVSGKNSLPLGSIDRTDSIQKEQKNDYFLSAIVFKSHWL